MVVILSSIREFPKRCAICVSFPPLQFPLFLQSPIGFPVRLFLETILCELRTCYEFSPLGAGIALAIVRVVVLFFEHTLMRSEWPCLRYGLVLRDSKC